MAFLTDSRVTRQPGKSSKKKLMVAVRIRPRRLSESGRILHSIDDQVVVMEDNEANRNDVLRQNRGGDRQYEFDFVFGEDSSQETVYQKTTKGLVQDVIDGYNATVFAYGATGSGKTHTMLGTSLDPGIMIRALNDLFNIVRENKSSKNIDVTMSYLEIYNENIRDLLNPSSGFLELREDQKERNIQVVKLSEVSTNSTDEEIRGVLVDDLLTMKGTQVRTEGRQGLAQDCAPSFPKQFMVMRLLQKGNKARTVEPTSANNTSSRSHALLSVTVRQTYSTQNTDKLKARVKQGKLFMIDLAGSERASQTKNRGKRLVEGAHINRSLLALGNCINALSGGARYVNYRDSKLTRLLKDALSGNSHTCMIAHVSPASVHREETKNTLLYADRAKSISNKVGKNVLDISYHVSQYRNIISELRDEITRLRTKMTDEEEMQPKHDVNGFPKNLRGEDSFNHVLTKRDQLGKLKNQMITTFKEQMRLRRKLLNLDIYLMGLEAEIGRQHSIISDWEGRNNRLYNIQSGSGKSLDSHELDYFGNGGNAADGTVEQALQEIAYVEREQEKYLELKMTIERELESQKAKAAALERDLPSKITSEEEKEVLDLIIRVHELEVEKVALQTERLTKDHALRQRDLTILRYDKQRQICEEIITRQRQIMEEGRLNLPLDLQELYLIYQQELHSASYADQNMNEFGITSNSKLPPILGKRPELKRMIFGDSENGFEDSDNSLRTPSSSAGSDWLSSPLPPITQEDGNSNFGLAPASVLFPPIKTLSQEPRLPQTGRKPTSRLPRPIYREA